MNHELANWIMIDDRNEYYDIYESNAGYREAFPKDEDPNIIKPYGMNTEYFKRSSNEERGN